MLIDIKRKKSVDMKERRKKRNKFGEVKIISWEKVIQI
jgi:hypothetical protein